MVPPFVTTSRARLTERLLDRWLPPGLTRVAFTCGGSESVDAAVRLARSHHLAAGRTGRYKVIGRELSYHGTTLATLAVGGHGKRRAGFEPLLLPQPKAPACYCFRCPLEKTYPECEVACADAIEETILREGPDTISAFIAEPIGGSTAGALVPPDEYWPRVAEICRRHGVLVIADEVMTGYGRTGKKFGVDHWGVVPDILIGGKGLTGGYAPMGAVIATEEVVEPIIAAGEELMFYTYSAHPACCAVADKVLEILEREQLVERAAAMGRVLRDRLERLASHPNVADIRGRGLLHAVELVRDRATQGAVPQGDAAHQQGGRGRPGRRRLLLSGRHRPGPRRDHARPPVHHHRGGDRSAGRRARERDRQRGGARRRSDRGGGLNGARRLLLIELEGEPGPAAPGHALSRGGLEGGALGCIRRRFVEEGERA